MEILTTSDAVHVPEGPRTDRRMLLVLGAATAGFLLGLAARSLGENMAASLASNDDIALEPGH
jgi:hypothetical protein